MKTEISSTACGTVTSKSLLSQAFAAPHVHPRLRKRLSRCTLDCGFQTPESPALRGFVGGSQALATAALYLVLKSNGLRHPKIRLKKFGFSSKSVPTNIAKKLPPQRCSKPLFIAFFNFSYKWPMFAFTHESGYTLGFRRKIAHNGLHAETGAFLPSATAWLRAASEIFLFRHAFIYIHFPVLCEPSLSATVLSQTIFHRVFQPFAQTAHVRFHGRNRVHTRLCSKDRTQRLTRRNRGVSDGGVVSLPSERSARSRTSPGRVSERRTLPLWDLGREVLSKNAESLRDSDALMRVAVPKASRPRWAA